MPIGEAVDAVVEEKDLDIDIAAQGVQQMVAANRKGVTIPGGHPYGKLRTRHLDAGGDGGRAAVNGVESEAVDVIGQPAGAADAGDHHEIFARDA